jgi:hypothetical protein
VAVEAVDELKDQKTYFATQMTPKGFLPVFVVIENASAKDSFLFDQNNVGYAGVAAGSGPNLGLTRTQENLLKNKIKSVTLSPGSSTHGFLFIPVPKKGQRDKIHLQIPVTKSGTNETYVLNLIF